MNSLIRKELFVNGLSTSAVTKKLSLPMTTVETVFRQLLDLNKAETPKHLKVYEHLIFGGLSPSQIAKRMNTGEEDIRGILIDLEVDWKDNDYSSDSSSNDIRIPDISEDESEPASEFVKFFFQYEEENENNYDTLRIQKQKGDSYEVKYTYNHNSKSQNTKATTLNQEKLISYLMNTFHLLFVDNRPFYSIEAHIPLYPAIKFTSQQLKAEFFTLMEAILQSQQF
jgi:hypothetical protein